MLKIAPHGLITLVVLAAGPGCRPPVAQKQKVSYYYEDADQAKHPNDPQEDPSKIAPLDTGNPPTAKLRKEQAAAEAALKKNPNDKELQKKFVYMTNRLAMGEMLDPQMDRKVKYVDALRCFRKVLKVDPNNADAKKWSIEIEEIYRSMHKTIPSDQ